MFRGILLWMAFCLSLVVMWHFADFAAERENFLLDHYAMEGEPFLDARMPSQNPLLSPAPDCPYCRFPTLTCEQQGCESGKRLLIHYSRLQ